MLLQRAIVCTHELLLLLSLPTLLALQHGALLESRLKFCCCWRRFLLPLTTAPIAMGYLKSRPLEIATLPLQAFQSQEGIMQVRTSTCYKWCTDLTVFTVAMARFALDIRKRMAVLTKRLEITLGPDTAELKLRIGIHSGPVTGGVLRGARARFQLFGDVSLNSTHANLLCLR